MDYSFESVKYLFDTYSIKKNENNEFIIINRQNNQPMFGSDLEPMVKFAHTWVLARQNGRSRLSPGNKIYESEYLIAFNEDAEKLYNYIMASSIQGVQAGTFFKCEALKKDVSSAIPIAYGKETVDGLYATPKRLESFKQWVVNANYNMGIEPYLNNRHI